MAVSADGLRTAFGMCFWKHWSAWLTDDSRHMIDSITVRGHLQAAGAIGGLTPTFSGQDSPWGIPISQGI